MKDHKIWWMYDNHSFAEMEDLESAKRKIRKAIENRDCGGLFTHDPRIGNGPQRGYQEPFDDYWQRAELWLIRAFRIKGADRSFQDYVG